MARVANPKYLKLIDSDVRQSMACRPIHYRELDGSPLRVSNYSTQPNILLLDSGRPQLPYCRGTGNLGKTVGIGDANTFGPAHD